MLKNRIKDLEQNDTELNDLERLVSIGNLWRTAMYEGRFKDAQKHRNNAERYLKAMPEYREKPPLEGRLLYIDWNHFLNNTNPFTIKH